MSSIDLAKDIGNCETRDNLILTLIANTKKLTDIAKITEDLAKTNLEVMSELRLTRTIQKQLIVVGESQNELTKSLIEKNIQFLDKIECLIISLHDANEEVKRLREELANK